MSEENQEVDMAKIDADLKAALANSDELEEGNDGGESISDDEPAYSRDELKAMEMGWSPDKEALEGTGKQWIPADEFLRNQTWVDEIRKLKREVRDTKKVADALKEHNKIVAERAYEQAMSDLTAKKKAAAADDDLVTVIEVDEQIQELKAKKPVEEETPTSEYSPEDWEEYHTEFVADNDWYETNRVMRAFADREGMAYVQKHPNGAPEDTYKYVLEEIRKEFPDKFNVEEKPAAGTPAKERASAVSSSRRRVATPAKSSKKGLDDIPEEHRSIAMTLIKTGQLSEEDYLKQYFPEDYS